MAKTKNKTCIRDKQYIFDPRHKHDQAKQKVLNKELDAKYESSKIKIPNSIQRLFDMMYTFHH